VESFDLGVLGASSPVGDCLLETLASHPCRVCAFSRRVECDKAGSVAPIWQAPGMVSLQIPSWICLAPIWVLPDYFDWLLACGVRRIVVLSSTSRFAKHDSPDVAERCIAERLAQAEERVELWARLHRIEWLILRPTLIYGSGRDRNVAFMMRFVKRWRVFPLAGAGSGLRQPVHVRDVARACMQALNSSLDAKTYNLSGAECLSFRDMVERCSAAVGVRPWLPSIPLGILHTLLWVLALLRPQAGWSPGMADRMNRDQDFDHSSATRDFGFCPQPFRPGLPGTPPEKDVFQK